MSKEEEKEARIRPDLLQAALLHRISKSLTDLNQRMEGLEGAVKEQIPAGISEPINRVTATTKRQVAHPPFRSKFWFSVSITNDGDSDCQVIINTGISSDSPSLLKVDETMEENFHTAKIQDIMYWTDSGTASLRIRGSR